MRRIRRRHHEAAWLAWHTGYLTAIASNAPRKMPKLKTLMDGDRPKRRQTADELIAAVKTWMRRDGPA